MRLSNLILVGLFCMGLSVPSVQADTRILCAGDSITQGYGVSVPYPTRLANNTGMDVYNVGVGGVWAVYGLDHIDDWLLGVNPSHVLIMYGTNDTNDPDQDYAGSAEKVMGIARRVRAYGSIAIIGTIPPKVDAREYQMDRVDEFNDYLRAHAASEGFVLADIEAAFGSGSGLFNSDGFHPNDAGAEIIATTFAEKIHHFSLTPTEAQVPDTGAVSLTVTVDGNSPWTATANQPWINLTSGLSGSADGTIIYTVEANTGAARNGTITVANSELTSIFTVKQDATTLSLSPNSVVIPRRGATARTMAVEAHLDWTASANDSWIHITSGSFGSGNDTVTYEVEENVGGARAGTIRVAVGGISQTFTVNQWPGPTLPGVSAEGDFDGDGWAELTTFNPTTALWRVWFSTGVEWEFQWGSAGMLPVPADYNGDGMLDFALYKPETGTWYVLESGGRSRMVQFGWSRTVPVPGDYDGDGRADLAIFNPDSGIWYILGSTASGYSAQWGWPGVVPVPADYDGDGAVDLGIYTPASGIWSIFQSGSGTLLRKTWGAPTLVPVPGDYNSDGRSDITAFKRKTGQWYAALTGGGSRTSQLGWSSVIPVPADYDGDGQTDFAVYNRDSYIWYIIDSSTGSLVTQSWGESGDIPVLLTPLIHSWFELP